MPLDTTESDTLKQPLCINPATDLSDLLGCIETHVDASAGNHLASTPNNSGCDISLPVAMFSDVKAQRIDPNHLTLRQLQERLTSTTAPYKAALPLVKLGTFGNARTEKGSLRHDTNLLSVSGVEGDYDAGTVSPLDAADRLRQAGIAALIYTTPSHTSEAPRWRVLAPLAQQVSSADREALCARLNGALGAFWQRSPSPRRSRITSAARQRTLQNPSLWKGSRLTACRALPRSGRSPSR